VTSLLTVGKELTMENKDQRSTETTTSNEQSGGAEGSPNTAERARSLVGVAVNTTERARNRVWDGLHKRPGIGFLAAGGAGLALANALGVGEAAVALATGYVAYQYLRHGRSPSQSLGRLLPDGAEQPG
jgi:hypothetical protein